MMGEAKRRSDRAMISVLIPERGRPAMLERLIQSLCDTAGADQRYEILVAIDEDDPAWGGAPEHEPWSAGRPVMWFHGPRPKTLGEKLNMLARQARGDILWFISNDMVMQTEGWPAKFRDAVAKLPNGIGVPFPHDDLHPDHAAYPIITRKMVDAIGFMFPPWFPFWFLDTWVDQVGLLLGVRGEIDVTVAAPEGRGKSHGLKDVTFWATFFREMSPFRSRDALGLAKLAYGEGSPMFAEVRQRLPEREALCDARTRHLVRPEFARVWEANAASEPSPAYGEVKAYAEGMLRNLRGARPKQTRVAIAVPSGETWRATTANCIAALAAFSAMSGIEVCPINVQTSLISHGRNSSVKLAMESNCDWVLWVDSDIRLSPDTLVRLLSYERQIVGATYCKKVARPDGTFETLGRLLGPHPDQLDDGLYEAEFLPGGCLLVDINVYKSLGLPWYAETYRWDGTSGSEAFANLLRDYFSEVPPDVVVESLVKSDFGVWLDDHYNVSDEGHKTMSEDYFFIRKARRAGFKVWCCLKTTGELAHLGTNEVTCRLPEGTIRLAEAAE